MRVSPARDTLACLLGTGCLGLILLFHAGGDLAGEPRLTSQPVSILSLQAAPSLDLPLSGSSSVLGVGGGVQFGLQYRLPALPILYLSGGLRFDENPANGVPVTAAAVAASVGGGLRFDLNSWLSATVGVSGGYFGCLSYDTATPKFATGGNPFVSGNAGVVLLPGPWRVTLGATYRYLVNFYGGLDASLGVSYEFPSAKPTATQPPQGVPKATPLKTEPPMAPSAVQLKDVSLEDIFPVFRTYYDTHPLGRFVLSNALGQSITEIKVRFLLKEFMDDPKDCPAPSELGPGDSATVDLFALLRPNILDTTEPTKTSARIEVDYRIGGEVFHQNLVQTIRVLDRNATTWTDDRRVAAFVTAKDPAVLSFSKNVSSLVQGSTPAAINPNLRTAMAFHETLHLYGLSYSKDPIPIETGSQVADYVQFPRQTLEYKGGKCSDFSVLYSALLESVGIETAFITIPGHIFIAFSADLSPAEARSAFAHTDDLIFLSGKSWIPVEVTESAGFVQAWQDAAREWRENSAKGQAALYPLHEAWKVYEPVGLPGSSAKVNLPPGEAIVGNLQKEIATFVELEISSKVAGIQARIEKSTDPRKLTNQLGVLFARYGLYDRARAEFGKLLATEEYAPALVNLGNIYCLAGHMEKALDYYKRAYATDPVDPKVLLALATANHVLENYYEARKAYNGLKSRDPDLAQRFAYLDSRGEAATREARVAGVAELVVWDE